MERTHGCALVFSTDGEYHTEAAMHNALLVFFAFIFGGVLDRLMLAFRTQQGKGRQPLLLVLQMCSKLMLSAAMELPAGPRLFAFGCNCSTHNNHLSACA